MRTKKHLIAAVCAAAVLVSAVPAGMFPVLAADTVEITAAEGWFESAYVQWTPVSGASGYNVYADGKQIDSMLIRQYNGFYRADAVGLKAGSHTLQIVPLMSGKEDTAKAASKSVTVSAHDRTGFAWTKDSAYTNSTASGAYNEDGTLRSGAVVLYVTDKTKNSVSMNVVTDSKGGTTSATGIQSILSAYQKGYETRPLDLRCIGNITDPSTLEGGDLLVKGNGSSKRLSCGITIEGIGTDTVFNGFGLRIANASNVEVRNIGFMNCNSSEGDDVGLQQNNDHVWVHHCDLFYGDAGSDADQAKGDGALDTKTSTYITHSYNHFWDNGKCNLQGMKSESTDNYITYHHNWYDHSDSRHPRIRTCSVHIYNNYFDGNAKYGVGVTLGASAFVDDNYFRACPKPMMSSKQGTDAKGEGTFSGENGGIIKAYNNVFAENPSGFSYLTYQSAGADFDAYEVTSASATVPNSVKTVAGGTTYNNFDTGSKMYSYKADAPADVPAKVTANAGRMQGGDFKWQFNNSVDDASYAVNTALKSALTSYKSSIVAIGSGSYVTPTDQPVVTQASSTSGSTAGTTTATTAASGVNTGEVTAADYAHNFTTNGTSSNFFSISGNLSTSKGTMTYQGMNLTQCLKMESATSIGFTMPAAGTLTLIIKDGTTVKVDGTAYDIPADGVLTVQLSAGAHTVAKGSGSSNLFYMAVAMSGQPAQTSSSETTTTTTTTTTTVTTVTETEQSSETTTSSTTASTEASSEETKFVRHGDLDCNGTVELADAVLLAKAASGIDIGLTAEGRLNAECDGKEGIDMNDLTVLLKYLAGLIDEIKF